MRATRFMAVLVAAAVMVAAPACSKKKEDKPEASTTTTAAAPSGGTTATTKATTGTTKVTGTTIVGGGTGSVRQWAISATATTSYGAGQPGDAWAASQAVGPPDVKADTPELECGDIGQAWASAERNTVDTLTLKYQTPVIPTAINIRETYNPGAVTKVEVAGSGGQRATVYESAPKKVTDCPRTLTVPIGDVKFAVDTVLITVDQTQEQNWAEIDAVELVGNPPSNP